LQTASPLLRVLISNDAGAINIGEIAEIQIALNADAHHRSETLNNHESIC